MKIEVPKVERKIKKRDGKKLKIVEIDEKYYKRFYYLFKKYFSPLHLLLNISHILTSLPILLHPLNEANNNRYWWRHQNLVVGGLPSHRKDGKVKWLQGWYGLLNHNSNKHAFTNT